MKHDYIYEIIDFWLSSEDNEYYLEKLFERYDKIYSLTEKPVIDVILDRFISSCNNYIENIDDVDRNYYVRVLNKLYNNSKFNHESDYEIKKKITDYRTFVAKKKMSETKKTNLMESINNLLKSDEKENVSYKKDKGLDKLLKNLINMELKNEARKDKTQENAFVVKCNNYNDNGVCYSIIKEDDSITLNYHFVDTLSLIYYDSEIYKNMKLKNRLNPYIVSSLSFKEKCERPSITISIELDKTGNVNGFSIYKSKVKPIFNLKETASFESLKNNSLTKPITDASRIINKHFKKTDNKDNLKDITKQFTHLLNEVIGSDIYYNDYPFIYKVHMAGSSSEVEYQIANLNYYLFRIPYEDYNIIYDIICNKTNNKAYYSLKNYGHFAEKERYKLELKPFTYVGYNLFSLINDLYIKKLSKEELDKKYLDSFSEIVNYYNKNFYNIKNKGM